MNLLSGVYPVRGERRGRAAEVIEGFGDGSSQSFFFAVMADIYRKEGYEAFKKEDFINAIHFYTKGIKINCNDKELKAKLYNNRAIAHFKLGKMMRALICIFFSLLKLRAVSSSFLKKVIIINVCSKKLCGKICLILASQTYKEVTYYPRYQ